MEQKLKLPTRTAKVFRETRGDFVDGEVEDRPYRVLKDQFNELRGTVEDVDEPLTDMEILLAGGLDVFFTADGKRVSGNWPWTGEDMRPKRVAPKPVAKKAPAKKKAKKKVSKKK